ncbi:MAG: hypothetical protein ABJA67_08505 [Chthonomonadales bacterium]
MLINTLPLLLLALQTPIKDHVFLQWVSNRNLPAETQTTVDAAVSVRLNSLTPNSTWPLTPGEKLVSGVRTRKNEIWMITNLRSIRLDGKSVHPLELPSLYRPSQPLPHVDSQFKGLDIDGSGNVWIATDHGPIVTDGKEWWHPLNRADGVPFEHMTCIACGPQGDIWGGTTEGVWLLRQGQWKYFWGKRWLVDNQVTAILPAADGSALIRTKTGVSKIYTMFSSLTEKAAHYEAITQKRHNRRGWVTGSTLVAKGDPDKGAIYEASDNDGLWTAVYVGAEACRYAVTHDPEALKLGRQSLQALLNLTRWSGYPGFPARAIITKGEKVTGYDPNETVRVDGETDKIWYSPPGHPELLAKGDTSSDELDGHFFALTTWFDYAADDSEKSQIKTIMTAIMDNILSHDYNLIGHTGRKTRWAIFGPKTLNEDPRWQDQRPLNSLQLLSYLRSTYHISGDKKYMDAYNDLIENHHYLLNILPLRTNQPWWLINHSDDQLAFMNFYTLMRLETDPARRAIIQRSLDTNYQGLGEERSPLYNAIGSAGLKQNFHPDQSIRTLEEWPWELICWSVRNSQRHDVGFKTDKGIRLVSLDRVLPASERKLIRWNGNPWEPDGSDGGQTEEDGSAWLLAYWLGKVENCYP